MSSNLIPKIEIVPNHGEKLLQSLIEWQFSVLELCEDFSETSCPSIMPTESNRKCLSPVTLVAMKIIPQVVQGIDSTGLCPRKRHEERQI
jgi:hypothetical protein